LESTGNLYDYPRESIERRKLARQLRRSGLVTGFLSADQADDDLYGRILDLEKELAGVEEPSRSKGN